MARVPQAIVVAAAYNVVCPCGGDLPHPATGSLLWSAGDMPDRGTSLAVQCADCGRSVELRLPRRVNT